MAQISMRVPLQDSKGVRDVPQNVEGIFNQALVDRAFQEESIHPSKIIGGIIIPEFWLGMADNYAVVDATGTAPDSYLTLTASLAAGTDYIFVLPGTTVEPAAVTANDKVIVMWPGAVITGTTTTGVITVGNNINTHIFGLSPFETGAVIQQLGTGDAIRTSGNSRLTLYNIRVGAVSGNALRNTSVASIMRVRGCYFVGTVLFNAAQAAGTFFSYNMFDLAVTSTVLWTDAPFNHNQFALVPTNLRMKRGNSSNTAVGFTWPPVRVMLDISQEGILAPNVNVIVNTSGATVSAVTYTSVGVYEIVFSSGIITQNRALILTDIGSGINEPGGSMHIERFDSSTLIIRTFDAAGVASNDVLQFGFIDIQVVP